MSRSTKTGAKAERDALREEMLAHGCPSDLIAQEMRYRWGFRPREAYRHTSGWSQDQAALRFTETAAKIAGPPTTMIGTRIGEYERWPHGGRRPSTYVLTVLAATYGTTVDRLLDFDDYRNLPDQERAVLAAMLGGDGTESTAPLPVRRTGGALQHAGRSGAGPRGVEPAGYHPAQDFGWPTGPSPDAVPAVASGDVVLTVPLPHSWVTAATALRPAAIAAGVEHAPGSGSRRRRRDQLLDQGTGTASTEEEVFMAAADQSAEFSEWAEATNVGTLTLEQIDEDIRRIAQSYLNGAPVPLMLDAIRLRNRTFTLLEGRQHPAQSRALYIAAGRVCGLLAWMSSDVGRNREAETQARTGWLCAELADHDGLRAWIRATQSKLAYWGGSVADSLRFAEAGLRHRATDSARILLAGLSARAYARLGNDNAARSMLDQADEERAAKSTDDQVGGLYGLSPAQQSYLTASTYLYLRDVDRTLFSAAEAVRLFQTGPPEQRFYGAEAITLIDAAAAHLLADDLEGVAEQLGSVFKLPRQQRLETCIQRLLDMHEKLSAKRYAASPVAADLRGQIQDFRAGSIALFLGR